MSLGHTEAIARAVLYEGYNLYPYRPTAIKNRQRWTFGGIFPRDWAARARSGDSSCMQTQCLLRGTLDTALETRVRFLHIVAREVGELTEALADLPPDGVPQFRKVRALEIGGAQLIEWEEAVEREVVAAPCTIKQLLAAPVLVPFGFPGISEIEPARNGGANVAAILIRKAMALDGEIAIAAEHIADDVCRLTVRIENKTSVPAGLDRAGAQRCAFASTHAVLSARHGAFVSLLDPPAELSRAAAECRNKGAWPVLVGEEGQTDTLLSAPIILYDYPRIAPESPGDLFDGTEIDEILTLRILTMTEAERREMAAADPRTRALLERTEALGPAALARLHGVFRDPRTGAPELPMQTDLRVGDHVRLKPKACSDVMDIVLAGQIAVVEAIERDFENRVHVAVTLLDDPGRDLGLAHMPGHRFFFAQDEIEPVSAGAAA